MKRGTLDARRKTRPCERVVWTAVSRMSPRMSHSYYHGNEDTESPKKIKPRSRTWHCPEGCDEVTMSCFTTGSNPRDVLRGQLEHDSFLNLVLLLGTLTGSDHVAGTIPFFTRITRSDVSVMMQKQSPECSKGIGWLFGRSTVMHNHTSIFPLNT